MTTPVDPLTVESLNDRFLRQLLSASTVNAAAQAAVEAVRSTVSADISWCGIVQDGVLRMAAHSGLRTTEMMSSWRLGVGEGIGGRTVSEGRTHTVRDYRRDSRRVLDMKSVIDAENIHGAICAPLPTGAEVVGVIYAAQRGPRDWTPGEVDLVTGIGKDTGIALGRILSRQHERAETDVLRQTLAEARRTVEALTEVTTAVERSDDLGVGVAILAHRLGMVVELLGLDGELLRRAPATASAEPPTQWELTLGADPLATLRVRADRALAEPELEIATGSGQAITLQLARERAGLQAALRLHSEFLNELLVGPVADTQRLQERAALLGLDLRHPRHVVTIGVHGANAPGGRRPPVRRGTFAAVERRLHAAFPGSIIVHQQGEAVGLLATGEFDPAKVRSGLRRALETDEGDQALAAGLGRLCHRIDEYATSYTEAALGLDIACRRPRPGELLSPDDLGLYGILGHGSARGSLESIVENTLGPLVAADDKGGSEYVKTLEAFLASDRHLERTAAALHIHVNTVRYRLGKIQDDLGVDLHDVDTRFLLELALRVQAALHRH